MKIRKIIVIKEWNRFARWYAGSPKERFLMQSAASILFKQLFQEFYKMNKTAAWIVCSIAVLIYGYIVYHNTKSIRRLR